MRTLQPYIFLALYCISSAAYKTECPTSCHCYQQSSIHSIFCAEVGLTHIPNYFNFDVKILNFTGNSLPNMSNMFLNDRYQSLEILDLSRNSIRRIHNQSFRKLKNILEIDLSGNEISTFSGNLFDNNRFLNTIRFSRNPIEEISNYAFSPSAYLRRLNFEGCKIKHIRKYAFVNVPLLQYLNLRDNNLKWLSLSVVQFTPQLSSLLLEGNPWRCNRKLWLLLKWLRSRKSAVDSLLCVYGETENAILWDTMELNNPMKLWNYKVGDNVRRIRWSKNQPRKRVRRAILGETMDHDNKRAGRKHRMENEENVADAADYLSLDPGADEPGKEENTYAFSHSGRRRPELPLQEDSGSKPDGAPKYQPPWHYLREDDDSSGTDSSDNQNKEYAFVAVPPQGTFRKSKILVHQNFEDPEGVDSSDETRTGAGRVKVDGISEEGSSKDYKFDLPIETHIFMGTKVVTLKSVTETNSSDEENAAKSQVTNANVDAENLNVMFILIAIEFVLLAVLLYVLYKLWRWNKGSREPEGIEPLNNDKNKMKNYDTNSSGYKR